MRSRFAPFNSLGSRYKSMSPQMLLTMMHHITTFLLDNEMAGIMMLDLLSLHRLGRLQSLNCESKLPWGFCGLSHGEFSLQKSTPQVRFLRSCSHTPLTALTSSQWHQQPPIVLPPVSP